MHHEDTEVASLGLSTGAAVIPDLARLGVQVTGLDRADGLASTLKNQRWKHSYHVAVGQAGLHTLPTGDLEVLTRSFRCVHEGAVRQFQHKASFRYELGCVRWTLQSPDAWQTAALAATLARDLPDAPTWAILLGTGTEMGRCTGLCTVGEQIAPAHSLGASGY